MDIYTLIHNDHETAKDLIAKIKSLPDVRYPDRFALFVQLKEAILDHNDAEAASFYVALERLKNVRGEIAHGREDHAHVAYLLEKLSDPEMAPVAWNTLFAEFERVLLHHINEEEGKVFVEARKILSRQQAIRLVRTMQEYKLKRRELFHKAI